MTTVHRIELAIALLLLRAMAVAQGAPMPTEGLAARTEIYPISSVTLTDEQFLTGDASGKAVTITGVLRLAPGTGRLPVVVIMHGSGGIGANVDAWSNDLVNVGVSTFVIDGFTGRGLVQTNTNQASLGRLNFIVDIYRALDILAHHPRVDSSRIVLMGFSRGGQAVLYASLKRFHQLWNKSGIGFAAYLPFYPDCATSYIGDADLVDKPVHVFQGTPDDYNPIAACKAYMRRVAAGGRVIALTEFRNAQHAFDSPLLPRQPIAVKGAQTVRNCRIEERPAGQLINATTGRAFTYADSCVESDPHIGYDAEATVAAHAEVKALIAGLPH